MNKIAGFMLLSFFAITDCKPEKSPWEGVWEMGRYYETMSGTLEITGCKDNTCFFDLNTANGAHTCSFSGDMDIKGNKATYREIVEDDFDNKEREFIVNFKLDEEKNIILIESIPAVKST